MGDVPFIRVQNIKGGFDINQDDVIYISKENNQKIKSSMLNKGDLILSKVGNIGYFAIVSDELSPCNISENNIGIKLSDCTETEKSFIVTYLNAKYANNLVLRRKSGNVQPKINVDDIAKIPIVKCAKIESFIHTIIEHHNNLLKKSRICYKQAEELLNKELNITNIENTKPYSIRSFSNSFGKSKRLDAEYYQDKFDKLFSLIRNEKKLSEIASITKSIEPGSNEYKESGIPFIRVSNLSKFGITDSDIYLDENKFSSTITPKKDTILFSKDGTVGIAYKVENDTNVITSSAILHLTIKSPLVLPDYLTLVLNASVVQFQAERDSGGSILEHWKVSEIEELLIPIVDLNIQTQIAQKVQESFKLRKQSKDLLEKAVKAVDLAIEQGEEKAIAWLNENTSELVLKIIP